jgi:ketosteroid isomerase-like protein
LRPNTDAGRRKEHRVSADDNIKTIQAVYEAFGRGDIGFILDHVTDDVDWATDTASVAAPWYGPHQGKSGVTDFFQAFGSTMTVQQFAPVSFAANDDEVHAVVKLQSTRIANGRTAEMNLHHWFQLRDGKISYYRGTEDTAQAEALFRD